ncbi:MAG: hypothetical protein KKF56_00225, partial [Nanoarchaeota archaeon]|nr:hypothetical protein [Nanoarchaeota archaeon]
TVIRKNVILLIICVFLFPVVSAERFGVYHVAPNENYGGVDDRLNNLFGDLNDLGVKQVSYFKTFGLNNAQVSENNFTLFDMVYNRSKDEGIEIFPWIRARDHHDCDIVDVTEMEEYLPTVIDRYPEIKNWKILKEPDIRCISAPRIGVDSGIDEDDSILIAEKAREIMDANCGDCNLVWGGFGPMISQGYYDDLIIGNFFDNFDVYGSLGYDWDKMMDYRPSVGNKEEWLIETGVSDVSLNESQYAKETLKVLTYLFSMGYDRVYYGVLYDWEGGLGAVNNFHDRGLMNEDGSKKEVFYSYKNMISKLEGFESVVAISDCNVPQESVDKGPLGNCAYKFTFSNKDDVYVVWTSGTMSLPIEINGTLKITNYLGNENIVESNNFSVTSNPVYIEINNTLTVVVSDVCNNNGTCDFGESLSNCPGDCNNTDISPPACLERWECNDYGDCVDGIKSRTCTDRSSCGTTSIKPFEQVHCTSQDNGNNEEDEDEEGIGFLGIFLIIIGGVFLIFIVLVVVKLLKGRKSSQQQPGMMPGTQFGMPPRPPTRPTGYLQLSQPLPAQGYR